MFPFCVYDVDYLDGQVIFNLHWHPELEFIYVERGKIQLQIGTKQYSLSEGNGFFIPSEQLHAAYPSSIHSPFKIYAIVFHPDLLRSFAYDLIEGNYLEMVGKLFHCELKSTGTVEEKEMLRILEMVIAAYMGKEITYELRVKGYLYILLGDVLKKQASLIQKEGPKQIDDTKTILLKKVLRYIDENYPKKLTVKDLASQIQMSEGHFSRLFKSFVRMTAMEYINTIRINKSCILLQKTDRKLLDIALDVGFQNQSYFIRLFKKQKGCTPREYKAKMKNSSC
ncbi:helix-turn-helix domain-containing protein [Lederbergia galactosidilytica]|uniref:HTH araC/xylS-type domain-containing protein n=2 Tax=Lederbergia galactosidilytica TaxID=217031 RepID=A0A0Q9XTG4_9BACI|nr:AraC family transcriptional regulator [Lederbergia galactosidilytica]KRG11883.1 hypothetical protein ACA29_14085 [Lederbergia galactosidilytica]KRG16545.1 hypothetical protein ACA30_01055 [Virgibacillus soli]MBP1915094.1 AraC-like DNA-binding protein [Lederbergia galactosidilytica]OAK75587.1 hypothetical protein ABB05_02255 [Lederbergia galactosidilytica]